MIDFSQVTEMMLGNSVVEQIANSRGDILWSKAGEDPANSYFYVEDISGSDNTLSIAKNNTNAPTIEVFKSTDGTNWTSMGTTLTTAITATVPANGKLYLKATTNKWCNGYNKYNTITASGNHNVGGNIMSLLYGDNFENQTSFPSDTTYNFGNIFTGNTKLVSAASLALPATTLTSICYYGMFKGCTSLTTAPELPATTLANSCYNSMFKGCLLLTTVPANLLPVTTLASACYQDMFSGCTSLTQAPALPATTLAISCYQNMFTRCTALTTAPELPATTLAYGCYNGMFSNCTSLTTAPALPATTLVESCYQFMFGGCTNLNSVTTYATNISASDCLYNWLQNVSATGTFHNMACITYPSGSNGIPTGWTEVHTTGNTINVTITNTGNYTGATYQIDSGTAQPINETGTTSFTVPITATTLTIHRNGKGVTDVLGICGYSEDSDWDAAFPVNKMTDNVSIDIMNLM